MLNPAQIPKARRQSFLDVGGANSLSNFASSFRRAQTYLGLAILENLGDNVSPCTLPVPDVLVDEVMPEEPAIPESTFPSRGYDHINTFSFPDEESHLLTTVLSRASGVSNITGSSTSPQTIFNAINTLLGIAMLSLSFGFRLSGWVLGTLILVVCAWTTNKTAKILGAILRRNPTLYTYGDIAYLYGGRKAQILATATFTIDLIGALVSLVLLFGDSFSLLFPNVESVVFKLLIVFITFLMSFLPLSLLSLVSLAGIFCTFCVFLLIVFCGFITTASPGLLLNPASTYMWPQSASDVILSVGLFMAPWGGHPVFPELYRDMRHTSKYDHCCNITFLTTFVMDLLIAIVGFLMFGADCKDSLTKNIMLSTNYPAWVKPVLCLFLGLLPVSKLALIVRPIVSVYEGHLHINDESVIVYKEGKRIEPLTTKKVVARAIFCGLLFTASMVFTSFGKVIAFLGSAICISICVTLPLTFSLKFFADEMTTTQRVATYVGITVGVLCAIIGTYGSIAFSI